jgi:hypothetical protein
MMNFKKISILVVVALSTKVLLAQAGFDDDVTDFAVPVDGGITAIVGSAIAYGVYKFRSSKSKSND